MFNKFKQNCSDVKATASSKIHPTVHFYEESLSVLRHWTAAQLMPRKGWLWPVFCRCWPTSVELFADRRQSDSLGQFKRRLKTHLFELWEHSA